jgi:hypothetical protein
LIFVENLVDWSVDDVYYWAIGKVDVDEESASVLKSQKVNGKKLWTLTEDKLKQIVPNFAFKLAITIRQLLPLCVPGEFRSYWSVLSIFLTFDLFPFLYCLEMNSHTQCLVDLCLGNVETYLNEGIDRIVCTHSPFFFVNLKKFERRELF